MKPPGFSPENSAFNIRYSIVRYYFSIFYFPLMYVCRSTRLAGEAGLLRYTINVSFASNWYYRQ